MAISASRFVYLRSRHISPSLAELTALVSRAMKIKDVGYYPPTWQALQEAISYALSVVRSHAPEQSQILLATQMLTSAMGDLIEWLGIDFVAGEWDEALVFSRASTATYWGPSGTLLEAAVDVARIQHDPVTGKALGLLIEPAATNILYPTTFESGFYLGGGFEGSRNAYNDGKFPDGVSLRVTYEGDEPGRVFNINGQNYWPDTRLASRTFDIYVKEGYCRYFATGSANGTDTLFDFDNPEYGEYATPVGGGWVRFRRFSSHAGGGVGRRGVSIAFGNELINGSLNAQRGDECVIALPSQYNYDDMDDYRPTFSPLPTSDSPVTRAADEVSIDLSDVFNPDEGTLRITAQVPEGEVVASLGDRHVISDSNEFKEYGFSYILHSGNTVAQLGEGIFNKVEYFPSMQGESVLGDLIRTLYGNGEQGAMYIPEPKVLGQQVLWQDVEGTVPVMSDGDPVGLMLDLSGNDNHATQSTSAARPTYRTDGVLHWLEGDGVDDSLTSAQLIYSANFSLFAGLAKRTLANTSPWFTQGSAPSTDRIMHYPTRATSGASQIMVLASSTYIQPPTLDTLPHVYSCVRGADGSLALILDLSDRNDYSGVPVVYMDSATEILQGQGTSLPVNFFGMIIVGDQACNSDEIAKANSYLANKSGVTL